jgi:hypothetical protein
MPRARCSIAATARRLFTPIRALAEAAVPDADRRARDRQRDYVEWRSWCAMRRELEAVAADPTASPALRRLPGWPSGAARRA